MLKSFKIYKLIFIFFSFAASNVVALTFSKNLSANERMAFLSTLGLGGATKGISSPLPLGGDLGIEMGVSYDFISTSNLRRMGDRQGQGDELTFPVLSFGKGLYYNLDLFLQFSVLPTEEKVSLYSAFIRWAFYDFPNSPIILSFLIAGNASSYSDLIGLKTTSSDLILSYYLDNLSLYFGGGYVRAVGTFYGGPLSLSNDQQTHLHEVSDFHNVVGLDYDFKPYFLAFEINRYTDTVFALKFGIRL